jgi:diguanylate cyclase (GGDEF)-like protein
MDASSTSISALRSDGRHGSARRVDAGVLAGFVLLWLLIVGVCLRDMDQEVEHRSRELVSAAELSVRAKAQELQGLFRELYVSTRTISLLPGLREAPAQNRRLGAGNAPELSPRDAQTLQQLYNHQASLLSVSKVYVVYDGFKPQLGEQPFVTLDEMLVDRFRARLNRQQALAHLPHLPDLSTLEPTGAGGVSVMLMSRQALHDSLRSNASPTLAGPDVPVQNEQEEFAYLAAQLDLERQRHPNMPLHGLDGLSMSVSPLLMTSDNTQYLSLRGGDNRDRMGFVFSSPVYDQDSGRFKGLVAVVLRANVLEARLVGWPFLPLTESDRTEAARLNLDLSTAPADWLLEQPERGARIADRRNAELARWLEGEGLALSGPGAPASANAARDTAGAAGEHLLERRGVLRVSAEVPLGVDASWWLHRYLPPAAFEGIEQEARATLALRAAVATLVLLLLGGSVLYVMRVQRQGHARLHELANFDPLTGLPNRRQLNERVLTALDAARLRGGRMAVIMIDLDDFKQVNDTLGHGSGDRMLVELARRFTARLGAARSTGAESPVRRAEGAVIGRLGGDEFLVLLPQVDNEREALAVVDDLLATLLEPVLLDGQATYCRASIGVALHPQHGHDASTLLRSADQAMYAAKRVHGSSVALFEQELDQDSVRRLRLLSELHGALERQEFLLHYQPVLDLASGRFRGAEALLRWRHPQFGLVSPGEFVPLLERSGLIVPVGRWVLREAARQAQIWRAKGSPLQNISVNLSAIQIAQTDYSAEAVHIVSSAGVTPQALTVEITESVLMDNCERNIAQLEVLRAAGMRLAIDDFGKGYSSLGYLRQFPVNVLKIDRALLTDANSAPGRAILYTVADLARRMNMAAVGEGAEDREQFDTLVDAGCTAIQGYFLARPMLPDQADELARRFVLQEHLALHPPLPALPAFTRDPLLVQVLDRPGLPRQSGPIAHRDAEDSSMALL